jgi:hypothetical protein
MSSQECREKVLAKLTTARYELEDALNLTTQVERYDSAVLPELTRIKLRFDDRRSQRRSAPA